MRKRNQNLGWAELWFRLRKRGYRRCIKSLYRIIKCLGLFDTKENNKHKKYNTKPYEQMRRPGERIQIGVKVMPKNCISPKLSELRLYQFTAIDEYSRLRFLGAYSEQSTYTAADFMKRALGYFARKDIEVKCVQTDNGTAVSHYPWRIRAGT